MVGRVAVACALIACGRGGFDSIPDASPTNDPHNCGRPGHDCRGGTCVAGTCSPFTVATGQSGVWHIALDASRVYWTIDVSPGAIRACPLDGCGASAPDTIATNSTEITRLVIAGGTVYFSEWTDGAVATCPLAACSTPTVLATGETMPMGVDLVGSDIYWANSGGPTVRRYSAGATTTFATTAFGGPRTLAHDASNLYYVTSGGSIESCALAGCGTPTVLSGTETSPYMIAVFGGDVFWSNSLVDGAIRRCTIANCTPQTVATAPYAFGVATDDTGIYWVSGDQNGGLYHCPLSGCPLTGPQQLASANNPFGLAIDSDAIYWTNTGDNTVVGIAKP